MFTKILNFVKMSWMLCWRFELISVFLFRSEYNLLAVIVGVGLSLIVVFGFNRVLAIFPIIRLLGRTNPTVPADGSKDEPRADRPQRPRIPAKPKSKPQPKKPDNGVIVNVGKLEYLTRATEKGRITGFEPKALRSLPLPHYPSMVGVPGEGLAEATMLDQINVRLGRTGEENFAKALAKINQLARFATAWSIPVPDQERMVAGPYNTDIDCVLATKDTIYLIDLKNYKSGNVRYYAKSPLLLTQDVITGKQVGVVKEMSRNMEMATNVIQHHFPDVNIVPIVVFMPTDRGEGVLDHVYWPGGIRATNLTQFMAELSLEEDFSYQAPTGGAFARISNLVSAQRPKRKNH